MLKRTGVQRLLLSCVGLALLGLAGCPAGDEPGSEAGRVADAAGLDAGGLDVTNADAPGSTDAAADVPRCGTQTQPAHRAEATACAATPARYLVIDGGASACGTDADCGAAGVRSHCLKGQCSLDQCLSDSDCATGTACVCSSSYYGGNGIHGNLCMPAECRIDADCGAAGLCGPVVTGSCGAIEGLRCHTPADICRSDGDCCEPQKPSCRYQPTLGHWACQAVMVCSG